MPDNLVEVVEAPKQQFMLRAVDGTPLSSYLPPEKTASVWSPQKQEIKTFTPKFDQAPRMGEVVLLTGSQGETQYVEIAQPMRGQEQPFSVYAKPISKEEIENRHIIPILPMKP